MHLKKLASFFFLSLSVNLLALPNCPADASIVWDNCFGTYTFANGEQWTGFYLNGKYIPNTCEEMGLVKGTPTFGQCVLKLIDSI